MVLTLFALFLFLLNTLPFYYHCSSLWIQMNFYLNPDGPTYPVRLLLFYFDATLIFLDSFHIILFVKELG
jgi:hypothetical protein